VLVQWKQDAELPLSVITLKTLESLTPEEVSKMTPAQFDQLIERLKADLSTRTFMAYELASFDGQVVLWFKDESITVSVDASDVIVSRVSLK
jgi:hypothetical protein